MGRRRTVSKYDRKLAVQYAQEWWDDYNPAFPQFEVDCTNYVSQCLLAGGAPMVGEPQRDSGWWYHSNKRSFSWAVSHSLYWYLRGATSGLQGVQMESPNELAPGDVIVYDFNGDGRWDHSTIVVGYDNRGNPLVNAHTANSQNRYWSYTNSPAWTSNCKYAFFQIKVD